MANTGSTSPQYTITIEKSAISLSYRSLLLRIIDEIRTILARQPTEMRLGVPNPDNLSALNVIRRLFCLEINRTHSHGF